jgi:hypothetical protein
LGVFALSATIEALMGAGAQPHFSPRFYGYTPTPPSPIEGEGL